MDPHVFLDETFARVDPGGRATISARIINPSQIVESYAIDVVGDAAAWALVLPGEVSVFPGDEARVEIAFDPPVSANTPAGRVPFGLRVRSRVDPDNSTVVEGDLEVGTFRNVTATLAPRSSRGRKRGQHRVDVSNWGNETVVLWLGASDPDERLKFSLKPEVLELPIGSSATARLSVAAADTFMRGAPVRHQFTVTASDARAAPDDPSPWHRDLDGTFEQRQIVPTWLVGLGVLVVAVAGLAFWLAQRDEGVSSKAGTATADRLPQPAAFTLAAAGSDTMTVTWEPVRGADTYNLYWIDPDTRDDAQPTAFETTEVPGTQNAIHLDEGLDAQTEYCFQLAAVNEAGESPRTPPQCATTLEQSEAAPPGDVAVRYVTDDHTRAEVSWTDTTGGEAEHVVLRDGVPVDQPVPAGLSRAVVDLKSGQNCFRVFSRQGDEASAVSDEACIDGPTTAAGSTSTSGPGELGWIAVVFATQVGDAGATEAAEAKRAELEAQGFDAAVLNTADYPAIPDPDGEPSLFVYIGGFPSQAEASAFCDSNFDTACLYYEPGEKAS